MNEQEDDIDDMIVQAMSDGRVDARGALGARFDRWLNKNPRQKEEYRLTRGLASKAPQRRVWNRLHQVVEKFHTRLHLGCMKYAPIDDGGGVPASMGTRTI